MKRKYHEGIFYSHDTIVPPVAATGRAWGVILPHQEEKRCLRLLLKGLEYMEGKRRAVIISPLHGGRVPSDNAFCFFEGAPLPSSPMFLLGAKESEWYAEEEAGAELISSVLTKAAPGMPYAIVYADIRDAKESRAFASWLEKADDGSTFFIISSNLSPLCHSAEEMEMWKKRNMEALEAGTELMDKRNSHHASFCGIGILDAIERVRGGGWKMVADNSEDTLTAHAVLIKE